MRKFIIGSIVIILTAGVVLYWEWPRQTSQAVVRIGYNVDSVNHAPIIVAHDAGFFQKHNLNVELVPLQSGKEVQQALALGKIDIGSAGITNFFIPIAKGAAIRVIAASTSSPSQVFVNPAKGIKTLKDLAGRTVASRKGSSSNLAFGRALLQEGVSIDSVKMVEIEKEYAPIALMDKEVVDAAVAGEYKEKMFTQAGAVELPGWAGSGYDKLSAPRTVIAADLNFVQNNRSEMEKFITAYAESHKYLKEHPTEAASLVSEHINKGSGGAYTFSVTEVLKIWETVLYRPWIDPSEFETLARVAWEIGDVDTLLTAEQFMLIDYSKELSNE